MTTWIVLIPVLPLSAAVARSHRASVPAFTLAFLLSVAACVQVALHGPIRLDLYTLMESGSLIVEMGLYLDALAALVLLLVTGVSAAVHLFSSRYMQGDPRYGRLFAVMSFFAFAMIMLVMSTNLLMLYLFWEVMGLCSYLLISHQAERPAAGAAATRVFLTNAVADVGLGLAVLLSFATFGTLDIQRILAAAPAAVGQTVNLLGWLGLEWRVGVVTVIALLLFSGAMGKSAQFPLHTWLPFAMEAPTPVSALIHAATLVKAGIFLIVRMSPLLMLAPVAMTVITVVGGLTALLAAAVALTQTDIKRILAYSTISQLGLMVMTCGAGAFIAAVFHLLAHGVVKAFLFLSSGGALLQLSHGHLPAHRPARHALPPWHTGTLLFAWLLPLLIALSGYRLLWTASALFWPVALGTIALTAACLARRFTLVTGLRPLLPVFLTSLVATIGLAGLLALIWSRFYSFLSPAVAQGLLVHTFVRGSNELLPLLALGLGVATTGWALASWLTRRPLALPPRLADGSKALYLLIWNKLYLDELHDRCAIGPTLSLAHWLWRVVDVGIIERAIVGCGTRTIILARWLWLSVDLHLLGRAVQRTGPITIRTAHWLWRSVDIRALGWAVDGTARATLRLAHGLSSSVDIRALGWAVEGPARVTLVMAHWLWRSVDIRGLERLVARIGWQNEATGQALHEIEPSMLQHQLLVMVFTLVASMMLLLIFVA